MNRKIGFVVFLKYSIVLLIGVSLCLPLAGTASAVQEKPVLASLLGSDAGAKAPDFELPDLNGTNVRLSQFKGDRPVLLYFWATWCPYCVAAKPKVAKMRQEITQKEMEILGINVGGGDSMERVKRFQEGHPVSWPILYDDQGKVAKTYRVQGIPLFVLVDKEGNEVYRGNSLPENPMKYLK